MPVPAKQQVLLSPRGATVPRSTVLSSCDAGTLEDPFFLYHGDVLADPTRAALANPSNSTLDDEGRLDVTDPRTKEELDCFACLAVCQTIWIGGLVHRRAGGRRREGAC